jgi:thioredoxin reductase
VTHDLIIIGAGPAGLSAAVEARRLGVGSILVLEREAEDGGAPRHCGHPGFGMLDLMRFATGPRYAALLRQRAAGLDIRTSTAATKLEPGGVVHASAPDGPSVFQARAVIVATGIREATRAGRMIGGARPFGVFTTTSLQRFVHLEGAMPFRRPIVIGTELVGLSALWTLRQAGVQPLALLEPEPARQRSRLARPAARLFGAPLITGCAALSIVGRETVAAIAFQRAGRSERMACDAVVLTGDWRPEAALLAGLEDGTEKDWSLARRPIGTSDPAVLLAGNVRYAVRSSGPAALEGRRVARLAAERISRR